MGFMIKIEIAKVPLIFSEIESELHWVKTIYEPHLTPAERTELLATAEAFRNVLRKLNARHVDPRSSMDGY